MGHQKEPNERTVPCLVCRNRYQYMTSSHLASANCTPGEPTDIESYRDWVREEHEIDPADPVFDRNQLQKPQYYRDHADRLGLPK